MIFDRDYDASLWYIVKADRKNRKKISDFIKEIPEKLLENIRIAIKKLKNGEFHFDEETSDFYRCVSKNNPRVYYYFQIDEDECLTITKSLYDGVNDDDLFELMLFPVSQEYANELENFEEEWIGTVTNNIKTTHIDDKVGLIDCNESEYNIYNTPFGHFVGYSREIFHGKRDINIYKPISLRRMPDDIKRENILCKKLVLNKNIRNK